MFRIVVVICAGFVLTGLAQDKSVKPGINDNFKDPNLKKFIGMFEGESREVSVQREKIIEAAGLKPGMKIADIGAGTGLFTREFAKKVGTDGYVYAVDLTPKFVEYIRDTCHKSAITNVSPVLCSLDSVSLPPASIDRAFICDTYHHFEFPQKTLASLRWALQPHGRIILIDFKRIPGKSSDWILNHVRAGQEQVEKEFADAGFRKVQEDSAILKDNYFLIFEKIDKK